MTMLLSKILLNVDGCGDDELLLVEWSVELIIITVEVGPDVDKVDWAADEVLPEVGTIVVPI